MKIHFILAGAMLLGLDAASHAQFSRKPEFPRNSQPVVINQLKQQIASLEKKRISLLHEYTPNSLAVRQADTKIFTLRSRLKVEQRKALLHGASNYRWISPRS